jgi:rubrerythrin
MGSWTLDDIPWGRFDRSRLEVEIVASVKAASLVEMNGGAYARHLCLVFAEDSEFQASARRWGEDETRHGRALGRWAELADPGFDFAAAFARFQAGYQIDFDRDTSRRGSGAGEMIARCIVETGTSSYYTAVADWVDEPVLRAICRHIAADEYRHYKLFYRKLVDCLERERIGLWRRLCIALGRIAEAQDDELAYAYYAANETARPYDRRRYSRAYARGTLAVLREAHIARAVKLILKAVGLPPYGRLSHTASRLAWAALRRRALDLAKAAA